MVSIRFFNGDGPIMIVPGASDSAVQLDGGPAGERAAALELLGAAAWIAGTDEISEIPNRRLAAELDVLPTELSRRKSSLRRLLDEIALPCPSAGQAWSDFIGLTRHDRNVAVRFRFDRIRCDLTEVAAMATQSPGELSAMFESSALKLPHFFKLDRGARKEAWRTKLRAQLSKIGAVPPTYGGHSTWITSSNRELLNPRTEPVVVRKESLGFKDRPFLGREVELDRMRASLVEEYNGPVVVAGPSNIGKSHLAYEFVAKHGHNFQVVYWFPRANSKADLTQEIATLAQQRLQVPESEFMSFLAQRTRGLLAQLIDEGKPALLVVDGTRLDELQMFFQSHVASTLEGKQLNARLLITSTHTRWDDFAGELIELVNDREFVELLIVELRETEPALHAALRNRYAPPGTDASEETGLVRQFVEIAGRRSRSEEDRRKAIDRIVEKLEAPKFSVGGRPGREGQQRRRQAMRDLELVSDFGGEGARPLLEVLAFFGDQTIPSGRLHDSLTTLSPPLPGIATADDVDVVVRALRDVSLVDAREGELDSEHEFDEVRVRNEFICHAVLEALTLEGRWAIRANQAVTILNSWIPRDARSSEDFGPAKAVAPLVDKALFEITQRLSKLDEVAFEPDQLRELARLQSRLGTYWHAAGAFDDAADAHARAINWDRKAKEVGGDPTDKQQLADLQVRKVRRAQALQRLVRGLDEAYELLDTASRQLEALNLPPTKEALSDRVSALDDLAILGAWTPNKARAAEAIELILELSRQDDFESVLGPQAAARALEPVISVARLMIDGGNGARELANSVADRALDLLRLTDIDTPLTPALINSRRMGQVEAMTLRSYGVMLRETGSVGRAIRAHARSLEICEHATNKVSLDQKVKNHDSLARAHLLRGDMPTAEKHIKAGERAGGETTVRDSVLGSNFLALSGAVQLHQERPGLAHKRLKLANEAFLRAIGNNDQILEERELEPATFNHTFYLLNLFRAEIGTNAWRAGNARARIETVREYRIRWADGSETHPRVADCDHAKAEVFRTVGGRMDDAAIREHERALKNRRAAYGDVHHQVADNLQALAEIESSKENGDQRLAYDRMREALDIRRVVLGEDAPRTLFTAEALEMM